MTPVTRDPLATAARRLLKALDREEWAWARAGFRAHADGTMKQYLKWADAVLEARKMRAQVVRALAHRRKGKCATR